MIISYEKPKEKIEFIDIVDDILGLKENDKYQTTQNVFEFLMQQYDIDKCFVEYFTNDSHMLAGYNITTGGFAMYAKYLNDPVMIFSLMSHEMAHKYDDEKNITRGRVINKGSFYLASSSFPALSTSLWGNNPIKQRLKTYEKYCYYSHPSEIFARKQSHDFVHSLLKESKKRYKELKGQKDKQAQVANKIKEIENAIKIQKDFEKRYRKVRLRAPICERTAKKYYDKLGKDLYKQIKTNTADIYYFNRLMNWTLTFAKEDLYTEKSKERLMEIAEIVKNCENKQAHIKLQARLQDLGFVNNGPSAVQENIQELISTLTPEQIKDKMELPYLSTLYRSYDREYIKNITNNVLERMNYSERVNDQILEQQKQKEDEKFLAAFNAGIAAAEAEKKQEAELERIF